MMLLVAGHALTLAASTGGCAEPAAAAREAADWLAAGAEEQREGQVDETLRELGERLQRACIRPELAGALIEGPAVSDEASDAVNLERVERRLREFARAVEAPPPAEHPASRETARTILEDPMFRARPAQPGPLARAIRGLRRFIAQLFSTAVRLAISNPWLSVMLFVVVAGGATALLLRVVLRRPRVVERATGARELLEVAAESGADELLARARQEAAAGRRPEALRLLVTAATLSLRLRGLLPDEPGLTALEGKRRIATSASPRLAEDFDGLVELHDRGVYAGVGAGPDAVQRAFEIAGRLLATVAEAA